MKPRFPRLAVRALILHQDRLLLVNAYPGGQSDLWCAPGGGVEPGASLPDNLIREVHEETGMRAQIGVELPTTRYIDRKGRTKQVRYWSMHGPEGVFSPNREVDQIQWARLDRVGQLLTYERDLAVVAGLDGVLAAVA